VSRRRRARRDEATATLSITSMMDMMTIILIFLLRSFSTDEIAITPSADLHLPLSNATIRPTVQVVVAISPAGIQVDGLRIADAAAAPDLRIPELITALKDKTARAAPAAAPGAEVEGSLLVECDRAMKFDVLRRVLYSAGEAGFPRYKLVVAHGER
jgi:biopolymer transport protein ExbD